MKRQRTSSGQVLVIVGLGMVALIAAVGLVIDVGFAWADNRSTQNGVDAAAHAGAIVIVQEIASDGQTETDGAVLQAINGALAENDVVFQSAEYTNRQGTELGITVGTTADGAIPAGAQGVLVSGTRVHDTLLARIVGVATISMRAEATAVGGPASEPCPTNDICAFIPITFPTTVVTCDNQNKSLPAEDADGNPYEWSENTDYIIPLCGNNPGSVGWIDWYPPAGGTSELAAEICDPNPPRLDLPDWFEVTSTGNVNAQNVEDCLNKYAGQYILMPMFDDTCRTNPGEGNPCTDPAASGQVQWYHFPSYAVFELDSPKGAYVNGDNSDVCNPSGGNGATTCLVGRFVDAVAGGTVGPIDEAGPTNPSQLYAVQLIH
jgi:Flp pilus assembly protein TadG